MTDTDGPIIIESLCFECGKDGETRLLLTDIPFFRQVIVSSFCCDHCNWRNHEIQFGGKFEEKGVHIEFKITKAEQLDLQVVKSDFCTVQIPEIEFEVPLETQKGVINTIEGFLTSCIEGLEVQQPVRKIMQPEIFEKIEKVVGELKLYLKGEKEFTLIFDDPSGNSTIEIKDPKNIDKHMIRKEYVRTKEQDLLIGVGVREEIKEKKHLPHVMLSEPKDTERLMSETIKTAKEILEFPERCHNCAVQGIVNMVVCEIPHFKEIILMAFTCQECGYKTSEVKPGGSISSHGIKITLKVESIEDLSRDVLKSESASVEIPELEFSMSKGSLGGKFTTIEGLLKSIHEKLSGLYQFNIGDSSEKKDKNTFQEFLKKLHDLGLGTEKFTLIIDDPESNSYIQNIYAPDEDPQMKIEKYTRTYDQDEELGLHQMKVE